MPRSKTYLSVYLSTHKAIRFYTLCWAMVILTVRKQLIIFRFKSTGKDYTCISTVYLCQLFFCVNCLSVFSFYQYLLICLYLCLLFICVLCLSVFSVYLCLVFISAVCLYLYFVLSVVGFNLCLVSIFVLCFSVLSLNLC